MTPAAIAACTLGAVALAGLIVIAVSMAVAASGPGGLAAGGSLSQALEACSGELALLALTVAVVLGVAATERHFLPARTRVTAQLVHRAVALIAVGFLVVHILLETVSDQAGPLAAVFPFTDAADRLYLGLGTIASDLVIAIIGTSLARMRYARSAHPQLWRMVHRSIYVAWPLAILHGILMRGGPVWAAWTYGICAALVAVAISARVRMQDTTPRAPGADLADLADLPSLPAGPGAHRLQLSARSPLAAGITVPGELTVPAGSPFPAEPPFRADPRLSPGPRVTPRPRVAARPRIAPLAPRPPAAPRPPIPREPRALPPPTEAFLPGGGDPFGPQPRPGDYLPAGDDPYGPQPPAGEYPPGGDDPYGPRARRLPGERRPSVCVPPAGGRRRTRRRRRAGGRRPRTRPRARPGAGPGVRSSHDPPEQRGRRGRREEPARRPADPNEPQRGTRALASYPSSGRTGVRPPNADHGTPGRTGAQRPGWMKGMRTCGILSGSLSPSSPRWSSSSPEAGAT